MPVEVILPKVDMDMTHGTMAVWHVALGALVKKGDPLFDIETDKAAMEVEAPATGYLHLHHISTAPGDKVAVGTVMAWIYATDEVVGDAPATGVSDSADQALALTVAALAPAVAPVAVQTPVQPTKSRVKPRATPAARKAADAGGLDLSNILGTGPLGRIQRDDVANRQDAPLQSPSYWTAEPGPLQITHRAGTGVPFVLIHGFSADSISWVPLEKAMDTTRPVIRIDLAGHGKSPKRRIDSFAALARMLAEVFDSATQDHQRIHLIGHSLGAALALSLADIRGRQTSALTLIAPAGLGPEIDAAALRGIARASRVESLTPWLRRLTATPQGISDDYARAAMATRRDPALRACQCDMAAALFPDGTQGFDSRAALERLTCPTQIIWGRQDHILPRRHALVARIDCAIHLLDRAGHIPQIECPDRVARIISHLSAD